MIGCHERNVGEEDQVHITSLIPLFSSSLLTVTRTVQTDFTHQDTYTYTTTTTH